MIPEEKWFYFSHGGKASSIEELEKALKTMGEAEFRHHVNHDRNDFANWIENVFEERKLARSMREVAERDGLLIILDDFLEKKHKKEAPRRIKRLIIPKEKKLSSELTLHSSLQPNPEPSPKPSSKQERELSEKDIRSVVDDAKQVFEKEKMLEIEREERHHPAYNRFILKEFVYGFLLGLIFGLIMLGIIFNLRF